MSSTSRWASALTTAPSPQLQERLLVARGRGRASRRETTIQELRERMDALQRELDAVTDGTEAAKVATRHAERREREAAAELLAVARTGEMQGDKLRELGEELREKDGRVKVLEAIVATLTNKW